MTPVMTIGVRGSGAANDAAQAIGNKAPKPCKGGAPADVAKFTYSLQARARNPARIITNASGGNQTATERINRRTILVRIRIKA